MRPRALLFATVLALSVGIAQPSQAQQKPYTMADLRALSQQKAWSEILAHLEDIAPASRDTEWRSIAQQAGLGALTLAGQRSPAEGVELSESLLARYPLLKDSRELMAKRAELGVQAFERCFRKDEWAERCAERLKPFVEADPTNQDLAFRLGKLLPPKSPGRLAVPAFAVAIQTKDDPRCSDPDVRRAVVSGLRLPKSGNEEVVLASVRLASVQCWQALEPAIVEAMGGDSTDYLANVCPFVRARRSLSNLLSKRCDGVSQAPARP